MKGEVVGGGLGGFVGWAWVEGADGGGVARVVFVAVDISEVEGERGFVIDGCDVDDGGAEHVGVKRQQAIEVGAVVTVGKAACAVKVGGGGEGEGTSGWGEGGGTAGKVGLEGGGRTTLAQVVGKDARGCNDGEGLVFKGAVFVVSGDERVPEPWSPVDDAGAFRLGDSGEGDSIVAEGAVDSGDSACGRYAILNTKVHDS